MFSCLKRGADYLFIIRLMPLPDPKPIIPFLIKIQNGFSVPVPDYCCCPGKEAVKWVI